MMDDIMEDMEEEESDSDMYEGDNEPEYVRVSYWCAYLKFSL